MIGRWSCRRHIFILTGISILSCSSLSFGQGQSQYDKGTPPQHAAGVSPLGSYTSTDLGSVNLSNGALNFKIPLATVGGRGFAIPLTLNYSSKVWSASMDTAEDNNSNPFQAAYADYANIEGFVDFYQRLGPGWTMGAAPMIFNRIVRIGQLPPQGPFDEGCYTYTVPKLTVMLPDKGEIEFRDDILATTQTVYEGANQKAKSVTEYDVYDDDQNHAPLVSYSPVSQHDSIYGPLKKTRGNPTRVGIWLNTTDSYIYAFPRYDILGNVVSAKDARGYVSTVSFTDNFGDGSNPGTPTQNPATPTYALPTLITSPPPLPGAPVHTARSQYDYSTGLLTGFRDRNDVVTQTIYDDPFNRPTQVKAALNVQGVETHVSNYYAPAANVFGITLARNDVLTVSDLKETDDASIRSWTVTDGFGRTRESWTRDPQGDVKVITTYDALGRTETTSNPFRPSNETAVYNITAYDLLKARA